MAYSLCSATPKPGHHIDSYQSFNFKKHNLVVVVINSPAKSRFHNVKAKATNKSDQRKKPNSVICADCDGNGAVLCSQCQGKGVNSVDFFNGRFKTGDSCWLCGGKKDVLCGNCNGAGFIGGFMSTFDE